MTVLDRLLGLVQGHHLVRHVDKAADDILDDAAVGYGLRRAVHGTGALSLKKRY